MSLSTGPQKGGREPGKGWQILLIISNCLPPGKRTLGSKGLPSAGRFGICFKLRINYIGTAESIRRTTFVCVVDWVLVSIWKGLAHHMCSVNKKKVSLT